MSSTNLLFNLPEELANAVLSKWLKVKEIVALDNAFCNHSARQQLAALFSSTLVLTYLVPVNLSYRFVKWLTLRQIKANYLLVKTVNDRLYHEYSQMFGSNILLLVIKFAEYDENAESSTQLLALIKNCPNVDTLVCDEHITDRMVKSLAHKTASLPVVLCTAALTHRKLHPRILDFYIAYPVVSKILRSISANRLHCLKLDTGGTDQAELWSDLLIFLKAAPTLRELYFTSDNSSNLMAEYRKVVPYCPHLQHIRFEWTTMTLDDVQFITAHVKCLKVLNITSSDCNDQILLHLVDCYKDTLEQVYVSACPNITNASLNALLKHCTKLHTLYCKYMDTDTAQLVLEPHLLSMLTTLHVYCPASSLDRLVGAVLQNATALRHLGLLLLGDCSADLTPLSTCGALRSLDVCFSMQNALPANRFPTKTEREATLAEFRKQLPNVNIRWSTKVMWKDFY